MEIKPGGTSDGPKSADAKNRPDSRGLLGAKRAEGPQPRDGVAGGVIASEEADARGERERD